MTDERVSDERLQEWTHENYPNNTVKKLSLEVITLRQRLNVIAHIKTDTAEEFDWAVLDKIFNLEQQNKELLADAKRLAEELSKGWSEMSATETHMTLDKHNALIETIAGK